MIQHSFFTFQRKNDNDSHIDPDYLSPSPATQPANTNSSTFCVSLYGSEAVGITVTFTSSQNMAAYRLSFKQTPLYPPDSLSL